MSKQQHLDRGRTPKRILALDGGGIRGILTLQYLKVIETILRDRFKDQSLLLCDYFDLIGGTSTGSIIAAGLACGKSVDELQDLYTKLGKKVFQPAAAWLPEPLRGKFAAKFESGPLQQELDAVLGPKTSLASDEIRTGLMIMTKRLDTGSPWPLNNSGFGKYAEQDGALLLTQVVRASTAAPTYFDPQELEIHSREGDDVVNGIFVDGGVTPFNDPALQLLMLAALQGHGFRWPTGKDKLLLISVGTGRYQEKYEKNFLTSLAAGQGVAALASLLGDCERTNRAMLQWLTHCLTPSIVDRAVGDMKLDSENGPQLATYARYNVTLEQDWLKEQLGVDPGADTINQLRRMDDPSNMSTLADLGRRAAAEQIRPDHLPAAFDLTKAG